MNAMPPRLPAQTAAANALLHIRSPFDGTITHAYNFFKGNRLRKTARPVFSWLAIALAFSSTLWAGPPFFSDDPVPVSLRIREFYVASQHFITGSGSSGTLPHVEVNYGPAADVQLHLIIPMAYAKPKGLPFQYGPGDIEFGVHYLFQTYLPAPLGGGFFLPHSPCEEPGSMVSNIIRYREEASKMFQSTIDSFLDGFDTYLYDNLTTLTGKDLWSIYDYFWKKVKQYRGNANGFTGLSEFLIFRFLYHLLSRQYTFKLEPEGPHLFKFCTADNRYSLGQSVPIHIGRRRVYPDVSLCDGNELLYVLSIKVYLTSGLREIDKENEMFELLKGAGHSHLKYLLLIYSGVPTTGKIRTRLNNLPKGFNALVLKEHQTPLADALALLLAG